MNLMKLYFMLAYYRALQAPNAVLAEMLELLKRRDFQVEIGVAQELVLQPDQLSVMYDLYILKSHTDLWLSLAGVLHNQGARLLNSYPSCLAVHNKIVASERLRAACIPTPRSWVTGDLALLQSIVAQRPLIVKPCIGGRGCDVHLVRQPCELEEMPSIQRPWLVQEYIPGPGVDLKLYVIGDQVFGVRKPFWPTNLNRSSQPCAVSNEVREIALQCGRVFGLDLYGLDVIESPDGPVVVDVNYFPSYKGVPNAANLLADYIGDYARGQRAQPIPAMEIPLMVGALNWTLAG